MIRKLVTVRRIDNITEILNADTLERAQVEGWDVVIKKGEFTIGDLCVYFEIDSFLPSSDLRFKPLMKQKIRYQNKEGCRIKTMKLRGQISQGLAMPLRMFDEIEKIVDGKSYEEVRSMDFSNTLNIDKWEAPIPQEMLDSVVGAIPSEISKTEQERIQNLQGVLEEDWAEQYEATVKLDGNSMTVYKLNERIGVCGRNWEYKETPNHPMWKVARKNNFLEALKAFSKNIALQGELIGEGIHKNKENISGQEFYLFDVFDIDTGKRLGKTQRESVVSCLRAHGARIVCCPVLDIITLGHFEGQVVNMLQYAAGPSLNAKNKREGVVFKRLDGERSFKVISNNYLLKNEG